MTNIHTLWKQILGAAVGAMVAMGLYYAYDFAAPTVLALLPQSDVPVVREYTDEERAQNQDEVVRRAQEILARLLQEKTGGEMPYAGGR